MSWYEHILICWENGTVIGYADPEKIKSIANKYVEMYRAYEKELDKLYEEEKQKELKKEKMKEEDYNELRDLRDKTVSEASMCILESISSGKSYFEGTKGCLWISGGIFNCTTADMILDELNDFFKELKNNNCLGSNIIGFNESEQSGEVNVFMLDSNKMDVIRIEKGENWFWGLLF